MKCRLSERLLRPSHENKVTQCCLYVSSKSTITLESSEELTVEYQYTASRREEKKKLLKGG